MNYGWRFVTLYRRQGSRPSPRKRNARKQMAVWGGLTNSCEKKRSKKQKRKGKIHPFEAEFQRIGRRNKKAFFNDQCKEIEKNNRMGKTRDLFKKIRDTNGFYHAKMGTIKDRNGRYLTEAEDIKKRCKNTKKNYTKKIFTTQITTMVWSLT